MSTITFKSIVIGIFTLAAQLLFAQSATISGIIISEGQPVEYATILIKGTKFGGSTDTSGCYQIKNIPTGTYQYVGLMFIRDEIDDGNFTSGNIEAIKEFDLVE